VTEAALAVLLLAGAGLMTRTLWVLQRIDPGFADGQVLTLRLTLPAASYPTADRVMAFADAALDRIRALPGVTDAGLVTRLPLTGLNANLSFGIDGSGVPPGENDQNADYRIATPGYFRALGVPLLRGRPFDDRDVDGAPDVVIVNDSFARRFFPGQDAVGRRLTLGVAGTPWFTVVGIVGDVRHRGLHLPPRPEIYFARAQRSYVQVLGVWRSAAVVIRSKVAAETLAGPVRAAIGALDPDLPIARVATMEQMVAESIAAPRFTMRALTAFAAAGVVLACLALYAVMSCLVGQRTRELATRLALGADRRRLFFLVMRDGVVLTLAGATLGIGASLASGRALGGLLVDISAHDPLTLASVMLVVSLVAVLACYLPARRAARLDPAATLRMAP
jgi:putative ABC transport system permease protein